MLIRLADGRTTFIDFREKAPSRASRDMYLDSIGNPTEDSTVGWRSVGVPGTVRGLELAHQKYGHKPWAELVSPAINLARNGFPVSHAQMESWKYYDSLLSGREAGHLVSEHMGVAIVTGPAASDLQEKDLVVRPLSDKSLCFDTCLVMRRDDDSRAVNEFARTFLKQYAPQPRLTIQMQLPLPA